MMRGLNGTRSSTFCSDGASPLTGALMYGAALKKLWPTRSRPILPIYEPSTTKFGVSWRCSDALT